MLPPTKPLAIQHILAIASGKGGVGKSTTAVNLALALGQKVGRVGILDADIYGPSVPHLLGTSTDTPLARDEKRRFIPVIAHGLASMSIGYLINSRSPAIWRGPMASSAILQMLFDTDWGSLNYLIIDLPPGTGDVHLTLAQKIPLQGAILVTTPQAIALADVRKAIAMFQKVHVPVLGIIENMSPHSCSQCGHQEALFGFGGGEKLAAEYEIPLLGSIPLDIHIQSQSDLGQPIVVSHTTVSHTKSELGQLYQEIASMIIEKDSHP